jgi:hypothetical protein
MNTKKNYYLISIHTNGTICLYPSFSFHRSEAVQRAIAELQESGIPIPVGTHCFLEGPCEDPTCNCGGKQRVTEYIIADQTSVN